VATSRRATLASLIVFDAFILLLTVYFFRRIRGIGTFQNNESNCDGLHRLIANCCLCIRPHSLLIQDRKKRYRWQSEVHMKVTGTTSKKISKELSQCPINGVLLDARVLYTRVELPKKLTWTKTKQIPSSSASYTWRFGIHESSLERLSRDTEGPNSLRTLRSK
jgi:hypothetical protein